MQTYNYKETRPNSLIAAEYLITRNNYRSQDKFGVRFHFHYEYVVICYIVSHYTHTIIKFVRSYDIRSNIRFVFI